MEEKNKAWKTVSSKYLFRRPWLTVRCEDMLLPNGNHIPEYYILEYPDWVNTIAITKDGQFVFVASTVRESNELVMNSVPVSARRKMLRRWCPPSVNCGKKRATEKETGKSIW